MKFLYLVLVSLMLVGTAHAQCPIELYNPYLGTQTTLPMPCSGWQFGMSKTVTTPAFAPSAYGTTAAEIESGMAYHLLYSVESNPNINAQFTNAEPALLSRMTTELKALDIAGYTPSLLRYAAMRLSATNLRLLQSIFGPTAMTAAMAYATPAVRAAYNALPIRAALQYSQYAISLGGKVPPYDLTQRYLYDLYLEQYFSGNDTPTVALHKATVYAQVRIQIKSALATIGVLVGITVGVIEIYKWSQSTGPGSPEQIADWTYFASINPGWDSGKTVLTSLVIQGNIITLPQFDVPVLPDVEADDTGFCVFDLGYPC